MKSIKNGKNFDKLYREMHYYSIFATTNIIIQ